MALSQTITKTLPLVGNVELAAHCRVISVSGGKAGMSIMCERRVGDASGEVIDIVHGNFVPALDGDNFIRQAYLHLKTLPEFANAVDC